MSLPDKPKLRTTPTPETLAEKQAAAERLLKLSSWADTPNNLPTGSPLEAPTAPLSPEVVPSQPTRSKKPLKSWEEPGLDKQSHFYNIVMNKSLFQKVDYVWKRENEKSMKSWILRVIEAEANKTLKDLGED